VAPERVGKGLRPENAQPGGAEAIQDQSYWTMRLLVSLIR
jgi:hypothetical protein